MHLRKVALTLAVPGLDVEFEEGVIGHSPGRRLVVMRVIGDFGHGSGGNASGRYLHNMLRLAIDNWGPRLLIIDFTKMKYEWSDMLEMVYGTAGKLRSAYVVGPDCRRGMSTLEFGETTTRDIVEAEGFFNTIDEALAYVSREASA